MSRQRFLRYYLLFDYQLPTVQQWGTSMTRTNLILPISFTPFAAVASHEGTDPAINIIVYENLSKLWDNWDRGANKAFYIAIGR